MEVVPWTGGSLDRRFLGQEKHCTLTSGDPVVRSMQPSKLTTVDEFAWTNAQKIEKLRHFLTHQRACSWWDIIQHPSPHTQCDTLVQNRARMDPSIKNGGVNNVHSHLTPQQTQRACKAATVGGLPTMPTVPMPESKSPTADSTPPAVAADLPSMLAEHPYVFHGTFFQLQATTSVGRPSQHQVPGHLFPLYSVLAGTAFPPEAVDEALVRPEQLIVGLINSIAPHRGMAQKVLPAFLKLLAQSERVTSAVACGDSATLTTLVGAVCWHKVMSNVTWHDVPASLLPFVTHKGYRQQYNQLNWSCKAGLDSVAMATTYFGAVDHSTLYWACDKGMSKVALQLLRREGARNMLSAVNGSGNTPLLMACERGLGDVAMAMLDLDPDAGIVNTRNDSNETSLYWACAKSQANVALRLLRCEGARDTLSVVSRDSGFTPLLMACTHELDDVAMAMLDLDPVACSIETRNRFNQTALYWACARSLGNVALRLLRCEGARDTLSVVSRDSGETPLLMACTYELDDVAMAMLDLDPVACSIETRNRFNQTALFWACACSSLRNVALRLLRCEEARDTLSLVSKLAGKTPLLMACKNELGDVAMAMLDLDPVACCINIRDNDSETALYWACANRLANVALRLLRCEGARDTLSVVSKVAGDTSLLMACNNGLGDVAMAMLDLDPVACCIKTQDNNNETALYWACDNRLANVALRLLRCEGARDTLSVVSKDAGDTPLVVACERGLGDVAMAMLDLDPVACNVGARNHDNKTALYWARHKRLDNVERRLTGSDEALDAAKRARKRRRGAHGRVYTVSDTACAVRTGV